jgi:hypothetical protein
MIPLIKKTCIALAFIFLLATGLNAQTVNLKVGSKLKYDVNFKGMKYNFIMTIKKLKPTVVFDYEMTAPANKKGTVTISAKDMDSARELYNLFKGGPVTLKGQTSGFLSRKVYDELVTDGETNFKPNVGEQTDNFSNASSQTTSLKVNGTTVDIPTEWFFDRVGTGEESSYHYSFTVLKNKDFPLITNMDLGWSIFLREMDNVEYIKKEE